METPVAQISNSNDDANNALIALARLLGRQAANKLVETEQADPDTPPNKDEGARDD
jgi:hypothetical protein